MGLINEGPKKVFISREAYERIVIYSSRYARREMSPKEYREVYGILVGYLDEENNPVVRTAIPVVAGTGAGVQYETKHYAETAKIDETLYEKAVSKTDNDSDSKFKEFFVGWWHTHPGFGFFFSETDTITHLGWQQANPYAIALIFDCTEHTSHDPGIEVMHLEDIRKMVMSPYKFIDYVLEDREKVLKSIWKMKSEYLPKLHDFSLELEQFMKNIKKKKFAQLQRNYGLLDIKKSSEEMNKEDILDDNEKYLYEWNKEWMKKKYRKPKFLQKIEKLFENAENTSDEKKLRVIQNKIDKLLEKPQRIVKEIKEKWLNIKKKAEELYNYLDLDEISLIKNFENKFYKYEKILNEIRQKSKDIIKF
ncbi:MAG: Mov34/MPN/PAD-1 family protein [Promethearchaeota archaeon]